MPQLSRDRNVCVVRVIVGWDNVQALEGNFFINVSCLLERFLTVSFASGWLFLQYFIWPIPSEAAAYNILIVG